MTTAKPKKAVHKSTKTNRAPGASDAAHTDRLRKAVLKEIGQRIVTTKILSHLKPESTEGGLREATPHGSNGKFSTSASPKGAGAAMNPRSHSEQGAPSKAKPLAPKAPGTSKTEKSIEPSKATPTKPSPPTKLPESSKVPPTPSASPISQNARWQNDREDKFFKVGQRLALEDRRARQRHNLSRDQSTTSTKQAPHSDTRSANPNGKSATTGRSTQKGNVRAKEIVKESTKAKVKQKQRTQPSALDAAAQVLAATKKPMRAGDLIDAMAARNLWKSPHGKTPSATLSAAIVREIAAKGKNARFKKVERGLFAAGGGGYAVRRIETPQETMPLPRRGLLKTT